MGLLKKIFKPVSKVLDKIVPNEVKPFLPYAAAFAPMFAPGIMGAFGGSALSRAAIGGGLNIFGQLAQEGNEGDINLLSAGLGALTGAMTGPGAADKFSSMTTKGAMDPALGSSVQGDILANRSFLTKATDAGLSGLAKGSDMFAAGMKDPFSMAGLKAATLPAATATGDLMFAQAKRNQDEADRLADEEAENEYASDASRAFAIRQSMESYGFTEQEILDAIAAAGYADGGRVGLMQGGLGALGGAMEKESEYITKKSNTSETDTINRIYNEQGNDGLRAYLERNPDLKDKYVIVESYGDELTIMENKLHPDFMNMENIIDMSTMVEEKAKGGRVGLRFGGIGDAVENIEDEEIKESAKFAMNDMDIPIMDLVEEFEITFKRKPNSLEELKQFYRDRYDYKGPGDVKMQEDIKEKVVMEAKDGGLMNLGGKEMDMRGGGFIPIGKKERADDVPARLSKNEFVMTADAVRAAGGGSVNEGAKRMYETMNKLEARA